jgi:ABC-type lipoprotein release transport system permease subunit
LWQFLGVALVLIAIGSLLAAIGYYWVVSVSRIIMAYSAPLEYWAFFLPAILSAVAVLTATIIPAAKASRLNPAEILRN